MGQLVDEADRRPAGEDRVEVHLAEGDAPVLDLAGRDDRQVADLLGGLGPAVGLDDPDGDVDPLLPEPLPLAEHRVGLAHAGRRAEVDLEPPPLLAADQVEELLGRGAGRLDGHGRWSPGSGGGPGGGVVQGLVGTARSGRGTGTRGSRPTPMAPRIDQRAATA